MKQEKIDLRIEALLFLLWMVGIILAACFVTLAITLASAYPYQLLENGTIIDLGTGQNITGTNVSVVFWNGSIYLNPAPVINYTIINQTYVNQTNLTCINCTNTYINQTNVTYSLNATNTYNKTEMDAKIAELNSKIPAAADFSGYVSISQFNDTITGLKPTSNRDYLSLTISIMALILGGIAIYFIFGNRSGD